MYDAHSLLTSALSGGLEVITGGWVSPHSRSARFGEYKNLLSHSELDLGSPVRTVTLFQISYQYAWRQKQYVSVSNDSRSLDLNPGTPRNKALSGFQVHVNPLSSMYTFFRNRSWGEGGRRYD